MIRKPPENRYRGRTVALLTRHDKGTIIAPALAELALEVVTTTAFDTDTLGTFSGEVERTLSPSACAGRKARLACELTGLDLGLGSEGSFGGGPLAGLMNWDDEILVLYDARSDMEITAFASGPVKVAPVTAGSLDELQQQLERFPVAQRWILRRPDQIHKGLQQQGIAELLTQLGLLQRERLTEQIRLEPDLRAMHCPERQDYIRQAAEQLSQRLQSRCPACEAPDFWQSDLERGLPCGWCGEPTALARALISRCRQCDHTERNAVTAEYADPGHCQRCNP